MNSIDIVIPVYNEDVNIVKDTILKLQKSLGKKIKYSIIVVDDGSKPEYNLSDLKNNRQIKFLQHETNSGYGSALKTGIMAGKAPWIGIIDADNTYPAEDFSLLIVELDRVDMVVGTRTNDIREIPPLRRFPKSILNGMASYMAGVKIPDLNSGMRVFKRKLCMGFWGLLPNRFSFTSTLTMGASLGGYNIKNVPINYYKRVGKSSIRPIHDTFHFLNIIIRMGILFQPMKLFLPVSILFFLIGFIKGFLIDYMSLEHIGNAAVFTMLFAIQIFLMGYLGELIVKNRLISYDNHS